MATKKAAPAVKSTASKDSFSVRMKGKTCTDCIHWSEGDAIQRNMGSDGECRRYPPKALVNEEDGSLFMFWPMTAVDQWCGEHVRVLND